VVEDADRHGNVRLYFRKRGQRKVRLPGPIGSEQFWVACQQAANGYAPPKKLTPQDEEVLQFEAKHPIGSKARRAFALLLYTGQRRSDIVRLGQQHVKDGWLRFTP